MTKIRFSLIAIFIVSIVFVSCNKKSSHSDEPNLIPGMGDAGGQLEVKEPLHIPIGLSLVGDISGVAAKPMPLENAVGSGGQWVILNLAIENTTDADAYFYLPAGSVVECQHEDYQHAIALNKVEVLIKAKSAEQYNLFVYCINKGKPGSSPEITYRIIGVSNSDLIMQLVDILDEKKIDIRDYLPDNIDEFEEICTRIQNVLWAITNGSGLTDEDWVFINSLAPLAED